MEKKNCYIITGGPGAGKTALLSVLKEKYQCIDEVARDIIKKQVALGGVALPWANTQLYRDIMLERSIDTFQQSANENITFFDRGIPDVLAYTLLIGENISFVLDEAAIKNRYNKIVFILPPWKEIYCNDAERKQDFDEAIKTYEVLCKVYEQYDYQLIHVPTLSIKERMSFVESFIP